MLFSPYKATKDLDELFRSLALRLADELKLSVKQ